MKKQVLLLVTIFTGIFISCDNDDDTLEVTTASFELAITGLENLGDDFVYEGWIIVNGTPITTGVFSVNNDGQLSQTMFTVDKDDIMDATTFVLTIEPAVDDAPEPSATHILAGDFVGNNAAISISHGAALGNEFSTAMGDYILATPSTNSMDDENKGLWFLNNSSGSPIQGLNLPLLPNGWVYEGWGIINGMPVSSGRFTEVNVADLDGNPYAGTDNASLPGFPGEDFIMGTVNGLNLADATHISKVVISIEPAVDNSLDPFTFKPLVGSDLDLNSDTHTVMQLSQNLNFPLGTVNRN